MYYFGRLELSFCFCVCDITPFGFIFMYTYSDLLFFVTFCLFFLSMMRRDMEEGVGHLLDLVFYLHYLAATCLAVWLCLAIPFSFGDALRDGE